jgi:hypothetical protein
MKLRRMLLITLLVLALLAALGPGPVAATPAAGVSGNVAVFATGLIYPRAGVRARR